MKRFGIVFSVLLLGAVLIICAASLILRNYGVLPLELPFGLSDSSEPSPAGSPAGSPDGADPTDAPTQAYSAPSSYMIEGVNVIDQEEFRAGCETYACTMLLQSLGFDMDEHLFLDKYLEIHWVYYGDDGKRYGPDMYSSQAGDIYGGWGCYCTAMAKYMNHYLSDVGSEKTATAMEGVPLPELCEKYISRGVPVMVWATTYMMEPYEKDSWIVNYVDENAKTEIGDTFTWLQNEHCLVLIGYDEENYYFADSCARKVSVFDRELSELRYEQLGMQSIVVE